MAYYPFHRKPPKFIAEALLRIERFITRSALFFRLAVVAALAVLVIVEADEFRSRKPDGFHFGEIILYFLLLSGLGLLIEVIIRAHKIRPIHEKQIQLTTMLLQKIETSLTKFAGFFRLAIVAALVMLVGVETAEFQFRISDTFHLGEIIIYFVLLGALGLLVEVVLEAQRKQQRSINILQYKHKMALELLSYQNWDSLTGLLTKQLAELVQARAAHLFFNKPLFDDFEPTAEWVDSGFELSPAVKIACLTCVKQDLANTLQPHYCDIPAKSKTEQEVRIYCYPIFYKDNLYALFRFILEAGHRVTEEQQEVLTSISDEIVISLVAGQDRKQIFELEIAESALAERHAMSHYLHDNLGQNLGYLRMKLEQFVNQPELMYKRKEFQSELQRMKDVADESYRFVRNKLEVSIPDSTPLLVNYLQEHARKVTQRSNIEIKFINRGIVKAVPVELQRAVFFAFQEALSNVERHSHATSVSVLIDWSGDNLSIAVHDNGSGFNVHEVSGYKHFGLEIMRERMMGIAGNAEILSEEGEGTIVRLNAPIPVGKNRERAIHV